MVQATDTAVCAWLNRHTRQEAANSVIDLTVVSGTTITANWVPGPRSITKQPKTGTSVTIPKALPLAVTSTGTIRRFDVAPRAPG